MIQWLLVIKVKPLKGKLTPLKIPILSCIKPPSSLSWTFLPVHVSP